MLNDLTTFKSLVATGDLESADALLSQLWTDYTSEPAIGFYLIVEFLVAAEKQKRYDLIVKWTEPVLTAKAFNKSIYLEFGLDFAGRFCYWALGQDFPKKLRPNIARAYLSYSRLLAGHPLDGKLRDELNEALRHARTLDSNVTREVQAIVERAKPNLVPSTIDLFHRSHPVVWMFLKAFYVFVYLWGLPAVFAFVSWFVLGPITGIATFLQVQVPIALSIFTTLGALAIGALILAWVSVAIIAWILAPVLGIRKMILDDFLSPIAGAIAGVGWIYYAHGYWNQQMGRNIMSQESILFVGSLVPVMLLLTPLVIWIQSLSKPTHLPYPIWVEPLKWREQQRLSHLAGLGAVALGIGLWACIGILIWVQMPALLGVIYGLLFFPILLLYPIVKGRVLRMQLLEK